MVSPNDKYGSADPARSDVPPNGDADGPSHAFTAAAQSAREGLEYASYFVGAKIDQIKATARKIGILAVAGILALVIGIGIVATATVLLVLGISGGIGTLVGHNWWLGAIITGVLILGTIGGAIAVAYRRLSSAFLKSTLEKYENRQRKQRVDFGRDVHDRAAGQG